MALLDASLSANLVKPAILLFADFADMPLRYAFAPMSLTVPSGLADADVDCEGYTFEALDDGVLQISSVSHDESGGDTLSVGFACHPGQADILAAMDDPGIYSGRLFRLWLVLHDGAGLVTAISPSLGYTGFMSVPTQRVDPEAGEWMFTMEVESWMTLFGNAPSRTYLTQSAYDSGDLSANVSVGSGDAAPGFNGNIRQEPRNPYEQYR
jgi:hypothetical protein